MARRFGKGRQGGEAVPPEIQRALEAYRAAVQALEDDTDGNYQAGDLESAQGALERLPLTHGVGTVHQVLQELFIQCHDVVFRKLLISGKRDALLVSIDGMVDQKRVEQSVLEPLIRWGDPTGAAGVTVDLPTWLEQAGVTITQSEPVGTVGDAVDAVLSGDTVLLIDGVDHGVSFSTRGWEHRVVEEPVAEGVIRGPREGFNENLRTNTSLIRRKIKSPLLKMEHMVLGRRTKTDVNIVYLQGVASPGVVDEVRRRLHRVDIDGIIDTGMIEELIEDQPRSVFPQIANTERVDRLVGSLLEGQVAILADGTPFALKVPVTFWGLMQASEDYYERFWIATVLRWLRYLFGFIALAGPALYIAITTFHQEMLPTSFLFSISAAREGVPFPAMIEALMMEVFFEALREAGVRLPRPVGQAVSIVGALVIGQAAVQAGIVSAPVVIIVASTGIASFTFPRFNLAIAIRLLRFPMMVLAGTLGLFGVMVGLLAILVHLCSLRSFGVPYLQPVAPVSWQGLRDVVVRAPVWAMDKRPASAEAVNRRRQSRNLKPGPGRRRQ